MTHSKARGTFINPGSPGHGDPRWFILDSNEPTRLRVFHAESTRNEAFTNKEWRSGDHCPKSWYNIEEEETVSEFKVGDRVKVEYEGYVKYQSQSGGFDLVNSPYRADSDNIGIADVIVRARSTATVTKVAPALPTKFGSVIDSHGFRFVLTHYGWHATIDKNPYGTGDEFEQSRYAQDFTVVLEGE